MYISVGSIEKMVWKWQGIYKERKAMTFTKKWTEPVCKCGELLEIEDYFYLCVNPDCEVISVPSTLVARIQEYNES